MINWPTHGRLSSALSDRAGISTVIASTPGANRRCPVRRSARPSVPTRVLCAHSGGRTDGRLRLSARECEETAFADVPLTPRHSLTLLGHVEKEKVGRVGVEWFYTGRQRLEANPFHSESEPYNEVRSLDSGILGTSIGSDLTAHGIDILQSPKSAAHILIPTAK